jgi:hypothetical protein
VNEGPHPGHRFSNLAGRIAGSSFPLAVPASKPPAPWFVGDGWVGKLPAEVQHRIERWKARWDAKVAGGPVLNLTELGSLIKQTQHALDSTSAPGDIAILSVQLEDMKHEFDWRTFLDVDETIWPAEPLTEPVDM